MRTFRAALIAFGSLIASSAQADSLDAIAAFAEKICNQSLTGGETSTTITANVNADVNGLAKALGISVGAGGLVKKDGSHYDGIPKEKLPSSIPTPAQCKLELAEVLIKEREKLAESKPTIDRAALRAELEGNNQNIAELDKQLSIQASQIVKMKGYISSLEQDSATQRARLEDGEGTPDERARAQDAIDRAAIAVDKARELLTKVEQQREEALTLRGRATQRNQEIVRQIAQN